MSLLSVKVGWWIWMSGALSLVGMLALTPLVIRLAHRMNWLAYPTTDRWHERPTALMGGIAIYASATLAFLLVDGGETMPWFVWGGATLMFLVGLADDLKDIRPVTKLIAQVLATILLLYAGYAFGKGGPFWVTIPLTFLWVIGITNAVNLLDNMDGLAAGVAAIAALVLAVFASFTEGAGSATALLAVTGAAGGFLIYNFKPARIFMGDCGSLFLGYTIAAFAVVIQGQISGPSGLAIYFVSVAVLAVPIFDTTLVTLARVFSGRPVSRGGQDHSSHRLVFLGLSERRAVLTLYGISLLSGGLALAFHFAEVKLFYALAAFFVVGLAVFGVHLGRTDVYAEGKHRRKRTAVQKAVAVVRGLLGRRWKMVLNVVADLLLVAAAFVLAHYLRFEPGLDLQREQALMNALPGVVGIKLFVFAATGLYRGLWRYAGTPELVQIVRASALASVLTYVALVPFYGTAYLSEAVFFIDWMIVTLAVGGVRFGFRGLRQYLSAQRKEGRRVLLYGAGKTGLLMLRALRQNAELELTPVGFIDDDLDKQGLAAQGLSVLGTCRDLPRICSEERVEEVLITTVRLPEARKEEVLDVCRALGVNCRTFNLSFQVLTDDKDSFKAVRAPISAGV